MLNVPRATPSVASTRTNQIHLILIALVTIIIIIPRQCLWCCRFVSYISICTILALTLYRMFLNRPTEMTWVNQWGTYVGADDDSVSSISCYCYTFTWVCFSSIYPLAPIIDAHNSSYSTFFAKNTFHPNLPINRPRKHGGRGQLIPHFSSWSMNAVWPPLFMYKSTFTARFGALCMQYNSHKASPQTPTDRGRGHITPESSISTGRRFMARSGMRVKKGVLPPLSNTRRCLYMLQ